MNRVISLSGGRTSAYMLYRLLEESSQENFKILFANTGKERDETLEFLHQIERRWKIDLVWLEYCRVRARTIPSNVFQNERSRNLLLVAQEKDEMFDWFKKVDYKTACRRTSKKSPFEELLLSRPVLPNVVAKFCSWALKRRTMLWYLYHNGIYEILDHVGIRWDEQDRTFNLLGKETKSLHYRFPLCEWRVFKKDVEVFWKNQDFDLQLESYEGNCDLCFLKAEQKLVRLLKENPSFGDWWIEQEKRLEKKGQGGRFRLDISYSGLLQKSKRLTILDMLSKEESACGCADGGWAKDEENED